MRKLAIFVEGRTEVLFLDRLIRAVAGPEVQIQRAMATGGASSGRTLEIIKSDTNQGASYYVLLVNSGTDSRVKSDIRDRYDGLINSGYSRIIGLRDAYPTVERKDLSKLREGLMLGMKDQPITVLFVLAVMEVEAWFIAEYNHFRKIHPGLTLEAIKRCCGFDPSANDMQALAHPSEELSKIYRLKGKGYSKRGRNTERTIVALDIAKIYLEFGAKFLDLERLFEALDEFLSGDSQ
jgi:hypothetical protein